MKLFKSFGIYFIGNVLVGVINLVMIPVYSQFLSPADYGILNLLMYLVAIATSFADVGQNTAFSILFYKTKNRSEVLYNSLLISFSAFALLCIPLIFFPSLLGLLLKAKIPYGLQIRVATIIGLTLFCNFFVNFLRLLEKPLSYTIASFIKAIVMGGLNILFIVVLQETYDSYFNAIAVSLLLIDLWGLVFILKHYSLRGVKIRANTLMHLLRVGLPLLPYFLLYYSFQAGDKYILNATLSAAAVGIYSFGYRLGSTMDAFLTNPLGQAISPTAYRTYPVDEAKYRSLIASALLIYVTLGMTVILGYATVGDVLFDLVIGKNYWPSFTIVILILVGYFLTGIGTMVGANIVVKEKTYLSPFVVGLTIVVNLAANFILIPRLGMYGAAISFVTACLVSCVANFIISQRLVRIDHRWREILSIIVVMGVAAGINISFSGVGGIAPVRVLIKGVVVLAAVGLLYSHVGKELISTLTGKDSED